MKYVQGWSTSWLEIEIVDPKLVAEAIEEFQKDEIEVANIPAELNDNEEVCKTNPDIETGCARTWTARREERLPSRAPPWVARGDLRRRCSLLFRQKHG